MWEIPFRIGRRGGWLLAGAGILALLPLLTGLRHGFYRDDFTWLEHACAPGASLFRSLLPWKANELRSLGQALFFLEYRAFGFHPLGFNVTSLVLHLGVVAMVVLLARRAGLVQPLAVASGILFLAGLGHYGKPASWACAQVVVLGTLFTAAAVVLFFHRYAPGVKGGRGAFPWLSYVLLIAALATHEITVTAPLGLALLAFIVRHPHRKAMAATGVVLSAAYLALTFSMHEGHPVARTSALTVARNVFQYPAALILPQQTPKALFQIARATDASPLALAFMDALVVAVGAAAIAAGIAFTRKASPLLRGLEAFGLLLLSPALLMPMPPHWLEVRYLYPAAVFWAPTFCAALAVLARGLPRRTAPLLVGAVGLWFAGILAGSFYIQRRAREEAADPGLRYRWERIHEILGGSERIVPGASPAGGDAGPGDGTDPGGIAGPGTSGGNAPDTRQGKESP